MIMAAGLGTRLLPFTQRLAKPFFPVMGVPLIRYALDALAAAGVKHAVVNVHHHPESSRQALQAFGKEGPLSIQISDESRRLLGSAGGIARALPLLGSERFFLTNADMIAAVDWQALLAYHDKQHRENGILVTLGLLKKSPSGEAYSEIEYEATSGKVTGIGQKTSVSPLFMSAAVLEARVLEGLSGSEPADLLSAVLRPQIDRRKVSSFFYEGVWWDIGSARLWLEAHLQFIKTLEENPECLLPAWKERINRAAEHLGGGVWVSQTWLSSWNRSQLRTQLQGPCFWGMGSISSVALEIDTERTFQRQGPPWLGPRAVCYGLPLNLPVQGASSDQIHFFLTT